MSVLSDHAIQSRIDDGELRITNMDSLTEQLQPCGIDLRLGTEFRKDSEEETSVEIGQEITFEPDVLYHVQTVERISLPHDMCATIGARKSVGELGLSCPAASRGLFDPGFEGAPQLEVYNLSEEAVSVESGHPFVQITFRHLDRPAGIPYNEKPDAQFHNQQLSDGPTSTE